MIVDISNELYTEIKNALTTVTVKKNYPKTLPNFPCVVMTFSTSTDRATIDSSGETHNLQLIDINIFTQSESSNEDVISIRKNIDEILGNKYRMTRAMDEEMENYADPTIDRWIMRYSYIISSGNKIYRG